MTTRFWKIATTEQKLAQIDGAIDLGLTSKQCAFNCGTTPGGIRSFASYHGRYFGFGEEAQRKARQAGAAANKMNGHRKFRQKMEAYGLDTASAVSARIFPDNPHRTNLFDPIPYEDEVFA